MHSVPAFFFGLHADKYCTPGYRVSKSLVCPYQVIMFALWSCLLLGPPYLQVLHPRLLLYSNLRHSTPRQPSPVHPTPLYSTPHYSTRPPTRPASSMRGRAAAETRRLHVISASSTGSRATSARPVGSRRICLKVMVCSCQVFIFALCSHEDLFRRYGLPIPGVHVCTLCWPSSWGSMLASTAPSVSSCQGHWLLMPGVHVCTLF